MELSLYDLQSPASGNTNRRGSGQTHTSCLVGSIPRTGHRAHGGLWGLRRLIGRQG